MTDYPYRMVIIEEAADPNVLVNGSKFELFCEIQANDGTFQSLFIKEGGSEVVVEIGKKSAVIGVFSTEENKLKQLFDYIEATISPNGGLVCYEAEEFSRILNLAEKAGGRYHAIHREISTQKGTFLAGLLQHLRPQYSLDKALQVQIQEHTVPVKHNYHSFSGLNYEAFQEDEKASSFSPAESLPSGWEWKEREDGSGHLNSPKGERYFSYDRAPYANAGGIEYKETADGSWDVFWGSIADFREYAEAVLNKNYLDNDFDKLIALAAEKHFGENCSVGSWSFDISSASTFAISYSGEPVVVCDNNQITDAKWGSRIAGVEVYDVLRSVLKHLPYIQLDPMTIRTDEGFSVLGFDGPSFRIADIPGMEDIDYYRAWVTSKPNMEDPAKKDHIVYWDQGNTWCEVLAVFQGITHEEFVSEMHEKYNYWIQEETDLGDMEDTMPSLSDRIQSATTCTLDSKCHSIDKRKPQESKLEL